LKVRTLVGADTGNIIILAVKPGSPRHEGKTLVADKVTFKSGVARKVLPCKV